MWTGGCTAAVWSATRQHERVRALFVGTSRAARGTEQHLLALALAVRDAGHQVAGMFHPESFLARAAGLSGLPFTAGIFRNALDPRGIAGLLRATRIGRPDWIVASFGHEYWPVALIGSLLGCRVCLFRHLPTPLRTLSRAVLPRLAHRFVAVSEFQRRALLASGIPRRRVQLLYNPIDLSRFRRDREARSELRGRLGVGEREMLVGFVGSIDKNKGALTLARAANLSMRECSGLRFLWVGQEAGHRWIERALDPDLRSRHAFLPWTDAPERVYPAMDLLAVPSEWEEPFGRVSVEAQACGVPVLASDVGGLPETLAPGLSGELVPPGRAEPWRKALLRWAQIPQQERERMGAAGRSFVQTRFSTEVIAKDFESLMKLLPG